MCSVDRKQHWYTRCIKEAIHIQQNNITRDNGNDIPGFWLPTIRHRGKTQSSPYDSATQHVPLNRDEIKYLKQLKRT